MSTKSITLSSRLTKLIVSLSFGLITLFSLVTFFVAYSLEDAMFNEQLKQAFKQVESGGSLPLNVTRKSNLSEFGLTIMSNENNLESAPDFLFGEFSYKSRHYHYMQHNNGILLMDVTEQVVVQRGMNDILLLLLLIMIPSLIFSIIIARKASSYALKPFNQLSRYFQLKATNQNDKTNKLENIEEQDVKEIADQLQQALQSQQTVLEEQIIFNQGMSHEIRSPLQIMNNSLELIAVNHPELYQQASIQRLNKSIQRMKRISNSLLWLTSNDQHRETINANVVFNNVLRNSSALTQAHNLKISVIKTIDNLTMAIPENVLELIYFNLINNAIHHGLITNDTMNLTVKISKDGLSFVNEINRGVENEHHNFGLGLKLVEKLALRFDLIFTTRVEGDVYIACLQKKTTVELSKS